MNLYKKLLFLSFFACAQFLSAQDTAAVAIKSPVAHEFGFNGTLLLKQVFNLSNSAFTMLPYDVTYKRIAGNMAWRFGLGATIDYSKTSTLTTGQSNST